MERKEKSSEMLSGSGSQEHLPENTKEAKANHTYYILKRTKVPVVIAECGFLSNYAEAEKLASEEYQREVAEAVAEGILQYIESTR